MSIRDHIIQWARENEPVSINEIAEHVQRLFDIQAAAAKHGMDAAKGAATEQIEQAKRLHAECNPEALESERAANARLTEENEALAANLERASNIVEAVCAEVTSRSWKLGSRSSNDMVLGWMSELRSILSTTSLAQRGEGNY